MIPARVRFCPELTVNPPAAVINHEKVGVAVQEVELKVVVLPALPRVNPVVLAPLPIVKVPDALVSMVLLAPRRRLPLTSRAAPGKLVPIPTFPF